MSYLNERTTKDNFLIQLKISQTISHLLYKTISDNNFKEHPISRNLINNLDNSLGDSPYPYTAIFNRAFPKDLEMSGIRVRRPEGLYFNQYGYGIFPGLRLSNDNSLSPKPVSRGADMWRISQFFGPSRFVSKAIKKDLPLIAGASGTTARWIAMLELMGLTHWNSKTQPARAIIETNIAAYLVYCGHHSMYEVGYITKKLGSDYITGNYFSLIHQDVASQDIVQEIIDDAKNEDFSIDSKLLF